MDIVIRAVFAFLFLAIVTRVIGRRELSSLEPFDLILLIVLGDLIQQGVTQSDYSFTGLVLAGAPSRSSRSRSPTSSSASGACARSSSRSR